MGDLYMWTGLSNSFEGFGFAGTRIQELYFVSALGSALEGWEF
jgi:hypothetical protein